MQGKDDVLKKVLIVVLSMFIISVIFTITLFFVLSRTSGKKEEERLLIRNTEQFMMKIRELNELDNMQSNLSIFQTHQGNITSCVFYKENNLFGIMYQVYMDCRFDEDTFASEVERLKQLSCQQGHKKQDIIFAQLGFPQPAYVTIFEDNIHEYALIDEENKRISYVFEQFSDTENSYIPKDKLYGDYKVQNWNVDDGYNMYLFFDGQAWQKVNVD